VSFPELHELVQSYSTPFLLEQYVHMRDQYTDEAFKIMEAEMARRGIGQTEIEEFKNQSLITGDGATGNVQVRHLKRDDFVKLEGQFNRNEGYLIRTMFGEENVPFFVDANIQYSAPVNPGQDEAKSISVYVHKEATDRALALIGAHFDLIDGIYRVKYSDVKEKLMSLNFAEIQHQDTDSAEITGVHFSSEEKGVLVHYGKRLLKEIDDIEAHDGRIVFFFDNVEELIARLSAKDPELTKADLLTALEVLQVYCGDTEFGPAAQGIAEALLAFFLQ
jgi:hypothetical protein